MFLIESRDSDSKARSGILKTPHGDIPTPIFMPVGTGGTVKGILQRDLTEDINAKIILGIHIISICVRVWKYLKQPGGFIILCRGIVLYSPIVVAIRYFH
jgi:hypothetical protein